MSRDRLTSRVKLSFHANSALILVSFPERRNPIGTAAAARLTASGRNLDGILYQ